jgi:hypothetical protein
MRRRRLDLTDGASVERWRVTRGEVALQVETNLLGVDVILKHALGGHAAVAPGAAEAAGAWTIRAIGSVDYEAQLAGLGADLAGENATGGLADYWRGDFVARRMGGRAGVSAVHHTVPFEAATLFEAGPQAITYLYPAGTPLYLPHLEHLVAHVLRLEGWARGFVDVHAAFVRYRGKGVALIGPRRAGKTSLAMHLVSRGGELLGSDMAQVRIGAQGGIEAVSIPHMCRITPETVWDNGWLAEAIGDAYDHNDDYMRGPLFSYGKYELYDPTLDRVFRRPVGVSAMTLSAILFPRFDVDVARHEASATARNEGGRRLIGSVKTDRPLADWLPFDLSDRERGEAELERRLASGEAAIPAYDFRFGREASLNWDEIDGLFDQIQGAQG